MLLESARRDKQYAPAWALANFYFRQDQPRQFWPWARRRQKSPMGSWRPCSIFAFIRPMMAMPSWTALSYPGRVSKEIISPI